MDNESMIEAGEAEFNDAFNEEPDTGKPETTEQELDVQEQADGSDNPDGADGAAKEHEEEDSPEEVNDYSDLFREDGQDKQDGQSEQDKQNTGSDGKDGQESGSGAKAGAEVEADKEYSFDNLTDALPEDYHGLNVKEFAEMYPEEFKSAACVAELVVKQFLGANVNRGGATESEFGKRLEQVETYLRQQVSQREQDSFDHAVLAEHPDAVDIVKHDPKFKEWMKSQSSGIKKMFMESTDPKDACMILTMYKGTAKSGGVSGTKRSAYAGSGSVGGKRPGRGVRSAEDEFDAGWNEK